MSNLCEFSCRDDGRQEKTDAPAASGEPPIRRLLRAFVSWLKSLAAKPRLASIHRLNDHMLRDIGLEQDN